MVERSLATPARPASNGAGPAPTEHLTDLGNARRLVAQYGRGIRYCPPWRSWLVWHSGRWARDRDGKALRLAKSAIAGIYGEAGRAAQREDRTKIAAWARTSEAENRIRAMLGVAESEAGIPVLPDNLDSNPDLLAVGNGTLDLLTGELREPDPSDLITRGSAVRYEPDAECPRWEGFCEEIFDGDLELIQFLQRFLGYTLTGSTREQVLLVLHGTGCNGKSTLVETAKLLLGDLAATAAFETFARVRGGRGPRNDLARLHRARMVVASESSAGRRLDEATLKQLTGSDTVAARFLYGEHFEFVPSFKLWLVTNHRPRVDGGDDAIWRRLRLVPFEVSFRGREDRHLVDELDLELPGILRWAVEGCLAWREHGLGEPEAVKVATEQYREDEDVLGAFLAERCATQGEVAASDLRSAYEEFCEELGERPMSANVLGRELAKRGIRRGGKGDRKYRGVSLQ